jgi:hypothetical protein
LDQGQLLAEEQIFGGERRMTLQESSAEAERVTKDNI